MIKQIGEELDRNFIKEGASLIVSLTFLVPKKQKGDYRMVVNYWKVNDMTKKDHYTMANEEVELNKLKNKRLFTQFDIWAGYNNIIIEEKDHFKAAFKTPVGTYSISLKSCPLDYAMHLPYSNEQRIRIFNQ